MKPCRYEHSIAGRAYVIEVSPVSAARWRAQIARLPGMPTSLMPFYGATPEEAAHALTNWLSMVSAPAALPLPKKPESKRQAAEPESPILDPVAPRGLR